MFEFFFKYPLRVFLKGNFVLLGSWPKWVLVLAILSSMALIACLLLRRRSRVAQSFRGAKIVVVWALQSAMIGLLLFLFWQPAISIAALKPDQNIIAVVVDDSRSMAIKDGGSLSREQEAAHLLDGRLLKDLGSRFQVRVYRLGSGVERAAQANALKPEETSTQNGKGLRQLADEAGTLPIGSVVLLSDGADTSGGISLETLSELRRRRLPVNVIGFGSQQLSRDVELDGFDIPHQALIDSRLDAQVSIRQHGFAGQHATLTLTGSGNVLATRDIVLTNSPRQVESIDFTAKGEGVKNIEAKLDVLPGETNDRNNRLTRVLSVDGTKRRILYVEGEPRWEYKFLRRAVEDDSALHVVSILRTTQNRLYRQGIANPQELADGFPDKPDDLFAYQGLILGSVETGFFTTTQRELIKQFTDRRGGGTLFLGGSSSLGDGGYNVAPFSELLPVTLPQRKNTFRRLMVAAELTDAGKQSLISRIEDDPKKSAEHWDILPYLANYQDPGTPKPGAVVLAQTSVDGKKVPLLVTENYGRGRTAVFATGGSWRWRMQQPVGDISQETFWRQLLRWLVSATPNKVVATIPNSQLEDDDNVVLRAEVRDKMYLPASNANVEAHIVAPDGSAEDVTLRPEPLVQGVYSTEWKGTKEGSYAAAITATSGNQELGKDVLTFRLEKGVAENFHTEQNRELLEKLAAETGGRYYTPSQAHQLANEISYSEAGISARELKNLWDMPAVFLLLLGLRGAEWLLRRKWGAI
jgi:uncharacterized membrane protein